jgi:hypothetical protein
MEYGFAGRPEPASVAARPWNHPASPAPSRGLWRSPCVNQEQDQITESDLEPARAAPCRICSCAVVFWAWDPSCKSDGYVRPVGGPGCSQRVGAAGNQLWVLD